MEAPAELAEGIVPVEADAVLPRKRPVQTGGPVQGQPGVGLAQFGPGKLQRLVQLVQHLHGIVQPEQTAIAQAVVALFLVERSQQGFQLPHRELPRVHLQVEHAAVHRHPHRDLRRCGLHTAEGIGQVDLALSQQGRNALIEEAVDFILLIGIVVGGKAVAHGVRPRLQIPPQQPPGPLFGAGIPQQTGRPRFLRCDAVLAVQKFKVRPHRFPRGRVKVKLHHRLQGDLIQQQAFGVLNGHPAAQLRQDVAAKGGGIPGGKEQALAAQRLKGGPHPGAFGPVQLPDRILTV